MSTSVCWELTCDGLECRPGGVKDSHPLITIETGDKSWLHGPLGGSEGIKWELGFLAGFALGKWGSSYTGTGIWSLGMGIMLKNKNCYLFLFLRRGI